MAKTLDEVEWIDVQSTVHVFDWVPGEQRPANLKDPEIRALIDVGHLVVLDDETRTLLPPPRKVDGVNTTGCGCG